MGAKNFQQSSGAMRRENTKLRLPSLRGAKRSKQSIYPLCGDMDCFASLAMTELEQANANDRTGKPRRTGSPAFAGTTVVIWLPRIHKLSRFCKSRESIQPKRLRRLRARIERQIRQHGADGAGEFGAVAGAGGGDDHPVVFGQPVDDELLAIVGAQIGFQRVGVEADVALGDRARGAR